MNKGYLLLQLIWLLVSLFIYSSVLISPQQFSYVGLLAFGIPVVIGLNAIIFILSLLFSFKTKWISGLCLLLSFPFWSPAYGWSGNEDLNQEGIKVLSYNVERFINTKKGNNEEVLQWIKDQDADVLCFQEFFPLESIVSSLRQNGKYEIVTEEDRFGVTIYSKFPMVANGVLFDVDKLNNIRFADIDIKGDTVRVYNVHLQSTGMNTNGSGTMIDLEDNMKPNLRKFVISYARRVQQMQVLERHVQESPYPVILVGDFNDIPYSYNYFQVKKYMNNAFEQEGRGFGFTFNEGIPFLRIDNQFATDHWQVKAFKTFNKVKYSDHYPIMGIFELSR